MKKLVVLLSAGLICFAGMAMEPGNSWVMTNTGKIDCKKVTLGYNKARIVFEDGQREAVSFREINSFSDNGKVFNKMPLYNDGKPTGKGAFMELITTQGDLSLYKLGYSDLQGAPTEITYRYFLYNGTKLHLALNEKTLANICLSFGVSEDEL